MKLEKEGRRKTASRRGAATAISSNYDSLFVHRKNALYRRAAELSAITDCNVGIILLSPEGELSQFSTAPMKKLLRSYSKLCGMPHEIHTMESIQEKCLAAGGEGIGLRVGEKGRGGSWKKGGKEPVKLGDESQGQGQQPREVEALEAIMSRGEGTGRGDGEGGEKRKMADEHGDVRNDDGSAGLHRLAKMGRSEDLQQENNTARSVGMDGADGATNE